MSGALTVPRRVPLLGLALRPVYATLAAPLGLWDKVALLAVGWWVGSALFGGDDDCS